MKKKPLEVKLTHADLRKVAGKALAYKTGSVDALEARGVMHLLTPDERVKFVNEVFRVLKPGSLAQFVFPHWATAAAYSDPRVQWPPVVPGWFFATNAKWRKDCAPDLSAKFKCDFEDKPTGGWEGISQKLNGRNEEYCRDFIAHSVEAVQLVFVNLKKPG